MRVLNRMLKDPHARRSAYVRPPPLPLAPRPSHVLRELAAAQTVGAGCGGVRRVRGGEGEGSAGARTAARRPLEGTGTESSAALEGEAWVQFEVGSTAAGRQCDGRVAWVQFVVGSTAAGRQCDGCGAGGGRVRAGDL